MPVTTSHQFIDNHLFKKTDKRAIIGTIHPHDLTSFNIPFFYGNVGSFWAILRKAFPQHDFTTYEAINATLSQYSTWVTDMITQCDRRGERVTEDRLLFNLSFNKQQISEALHDSEINTIYFTSRFGSNNAAKLFVDQFSIRYKQTFNSELSEFMIPANKFGRPIKCVVLYSPSGAANVGISQSKAYKDRFDYYNQFDKPITQFKVDFYKNKFAYFNN